MADAHPHAAGHPTDRLVGTASGIFDLRAQIRHLVTFDAVGNPTVPTVLLQGETGTSKGLVARIIHDSGPRAQGPFIEVNCAAIPDPMLEAELFGFAVGAFTDANRAKPGLFEAAAGGTLLTAIETKRVRRLGAVADQTVDVKCIAATNAGLPEAIAAERFRADLYHRLAVVGAGAPPVARQRRGYRDAGRGAVAALHRCAWGTSQTPQRRGGSVVARAMHGRGMSASSAM